MLNAQWSNEMWSSHNFNCDACDWILANNNIFMEWSIWFAIDTNKLHNVEWFWESSSWIWCIWVYVQILCTIVITTNWIASSSSSSSSSSPANWIWYITLEFWRTFHAFLLHRRSPILVSDNLREKLNWNKVWMDMIAIILIKAIIMLIVITNV